VQARRATTTAETAATRLHLGRTGRAGDVYLADGARNLTGASRRTGGSAIQAEDVTKVLIFNL